ncbi:MAG: glutathione S-transferase family protein [Alphaproteobacteria bacterium]
MMQLYHYPLDPLSRRVRLQVAEIGMEARLVEEMPWQRREAFLALNPAGTVPVLVEASGIAISGLTAITEFLDELAVETGARCLTPGQRYGRAEVRRLVEWFDVKFNAEVTQPIIHEKIHRRFMSKPEGGGGPDMAMVRAGKKNIEFHLAYIEYLVGTRSWLAGDELSHADLAGAAHLSCVDYTGDVPWGAHPGAKQWYVRVKSRPSFRPLLADNLRALSPPPAYADLDF